MLSWIFRIRALRRNKKTLHLTVVAVLALLAGILAQRSEPRYASPGWAGLLFSQWVFVALATLALFAGILLRRTRERYLKWERPGFQQSRLAFTLALWLTATFCFLLGFRVMHAMSVGLLSSLRQFLHFPATQGWNATAWAFLLLPDLLDLAFWLWIGIPERIWKTWIYYPYRDLPILEGQVYISISFSTKRRLKDTRLLRATRDFPGQWTLGDCYQLFVDWHNDHFPNDPIQFISDTDYQRPYRWVFCIRNRFGRRILDPDRSLLENRVPKDALIEAERVPEFIPAPEPCYLLTSNHQPTVVDETADTVSVH